MVGALLWLFDAVVELVIVLVIVSAVLSWLIAFDVINTRNRMMNNVVRTLDALTDPLLRPIRRVLPNLGGIDISPIILLLLLQFLRLLVHRLVAGLP